MGHGRPTYGLGNVHWGGYGGIVAPEPLHGFLHRDGFSVPSCQIFKCVNHVVDGTTPHRRPGDLYKFNEFTTLETTFLSFFYSFYSFFILPKLTACFVAFSYRQSK